MLKVGFILFAFGSFLLGMSLNECISTALQNSTAIKKSKNEIELSSINHKIQKVSQFGELNLLADFNHYNSLRTLAPITPSLMQSGIPIAESKDIFSVGFMYSVPLFTGFAQTNQIKIDEIAAKMSKIKGSLTKEEIIYNVKSLYLTILAQKELLLAQKKYYKALKNLEQIVKKELKEGKKARIDYLKAKAQTKEALATISNLKAAITITKASLSALIGKEVKRVNFIKIYPKRPRFNEKRLLSRVAYLKKIKISDMQIRKAQKAVDKTKSLGLPQINLTIYAGKNIGSDEVYNLGTQGDNIYQIGIHSKWAMVDFGKRSLQVQKAKIAKMQLELEKVASIRELKKLIKEAIAKIKSNYSLYQKNLSQLKLSKEAQKIEFVRYQKGVSTMNDLLLAKAKEQLSRAKLIESKYNYKKSLYFLDYILEQGAKRR